MSNIKAISKFVIIFFLFLSNSYSIEKVAFINIDLVIKKSNIGIVMLSKIETLNNQNIKKLKIKQSELKDLEDKIKKKQNIASKDEINKELDTLKKKIKQYNEEKDILVSEFKNFKEKELDLIMNKINPIVQKYMKDNSIEILFDSKNIYIGDKRSDLTEIIINEINATVK
tara:strand:+ start:127 stop:639 length:513 start_codon:yes stop_codon:yes gene_type:complete